MSHPVRVVAAGLALVLQLVVLYAPRVPDVGGPDLPLDKVVHAGVFALATVALAWAGVPRWAAVTVMAVHAPLSELIQARLLADRSGDPADVVADLVGVAIGAAISRPVARSGRAPVEWGHSHAAGRPAENA